jgi:hypothetical protein
MRILVSSVLFGIFLIATSSTAVATWSNGTYTRIFDNTEDLHCEASSNANGSLFVIDHLSAVVRKERGTTRPGESLYRLPKPGMVIAQCFFE